MIFNTDNENLKDKVRFQIVFYTVSYSLLFKKIIFEFLVCAFQNLSNEKLLKKFIMRKNSLISVKAEIARNV